MIAIYKRLSEKQIRKECKSTIKKLEKWFIDNPNRRVCHAQLWYGRPISIKKTTIKSQVEDAAENAISGNIF